MSTYNEWREDHADDYDELADWPRADKTIEAIRAIRDDHSARIIDGMMVDVQTANAIVTTYDAASEHQRAKLMSLDIDKMARLAWQLVRIQ